MTTDQKKCPDAGTCHHNCPQACFRVLTCGPLSGVYLDDAWPADVRMEHEIRQAAFDQGRRARGDDAIITQRWHIKPAEDSVVHAVQLTETNWGSVISWLDANGVQAHYTGPPPRLSFGGHRGSYCMQPGDWIALYRDASRNGAEGWLEGDWERVWATGPLVTTQDVALGMQAIVEAGDGLTVVLGHLGPGGRQKLRQILDRWTP